MACATPTICSRHSNPDRRAVDGRAGDPSRDRCRHHLRRRSNSSNDVPARMRADFCWRYYPNGVAAKRASSSQAKAYAACYVRVWVVVAVVIAFAIVTVTVLMATFAWLAAVVSACAIGWWRVAHCSALTVRCRCRSDAECCVFCCG